MMTADAVSIMVDRIVRRFQPIRILLFGSQARGNADELSDIDLLIVMRVVKDKRLAEIDIMDALSDLPVCKDIVVTTDEIARRKHVVGTIINSALREGRVVYEQG